MEDTYFCGFICFFFSWDSFGFSFVDNFHIWKKYAYLTLISIYGRSKITIKKTVINCIIVDDGSKSRRGFCVQMYDDFYKCECVKTLDEFAEWKRNYGNYKFKGTWA